MYHRTQIIVFFIPMLFSGLNVFATDNDSTIQKLNQAPICNIIFPLDNSTFTSPATFTIKLKAEDMDGNIDTLKLFSDKTIIGIATKEEFSFSIPEIGIGVYFFNAVAIDNQVCYSDTAMVKVTVTAPKDYAFTSIPIIKSSDDAEENITDNEISLDSPYLELTEDGENNQVIGLIFRKIGIPHYTKINNAYIQFTCGKKTDEGSTLAITGQLSANPKSFTKSKTDITFRPSTESSVSWITYPWENKGDRGYVQQTPNLKNIIQELVDQENFNDTSNICLLIRGDGPVTAESFDSDVFHAPSLIIEYKSTEKIELIAKNNKAPIAKFSFTPIQGMAPLIVTYDARLSYDPDGDLLKYKWDFGDGSESTKMEGTHTYASIGEYSVVLNIIDIAGDTGKASIKINATDSNTAPVARINVSPEIGKAPLLVTFDATKSYDPDKDFLRFRWDFGDGMSSMQKKEEHTYLTSDNYVAKLFVYDGEKYDTAQIDIVVEAMENSTPDISFTIDTVKEDSYSRIFDASGSSDPDGDNLQYIWSFGDGFISSEKTVQHTYKKEGKYNVTLTVLDENNNSIIKEISVRINAPIIEKSIKDSINH